MKAMQVQQANGDFVFVELPIPQPNSGEVRFKVEVCGICHSDDFTKSGAFSGIEFPRVPGHEVAGVVDEIGDGVSGFRVGDRVGVGWHGGHCFRCERCRRGDFINCLNGKICGISYDGGYQEYMVAPWEASCASPMRYPGSRPGHCFVPASPPSTRFATPGRGRATPWPFLGSAVSGTWPCSLPIAWAFAPSRSPAAKKSSIRSSKVCRYGTLLIVAAPGENLELAPLHLLSGKSIAGWPSGTAIDSEDTLEFSVLTCVKPRVETFPLEEANEAYARMMTNEGRFRAVLTMS